MRIRVFLADDHAVLRAGLRLLINGQSDMEVVGEAGDGPGTIRGVQAARAHVVLLDLSMPGGRFTQTIEQLVRVAPAARVLVLTMHDDPAYSQAALLAGAAGYVVKKSADVELLIAIRAVSQGRTYLNLARPATAPPHALSPREAGVLSLLAQGHTNQEAASRLSLSVKTIEAHRRRLSDKLGLKSRAELFRFAVEVGLLEDAAGPPRKGSSRRQMQ